MLNFRSPVKKKKMKKRKKRKEKKNEIVHTTILH